MREEPNTIAFGRELRKQGLRLLENLDPFLRQLIRPEIEETDLCSSDSIIDALEDVWDSGPEAAVNAALDCWPGVIQERLNHMLGPDSLFPWKQAGVTDELRERLCSMADLIQLRTDDRIVAALVTAASHDDDDYWPSAPHREKGESDMAAPQIRIFPHDSEKEFPAADHLMTWLLTSLRGKGGVYHLRTASAVRELPPGSIVLFRHGHLIVGEAVVWKDKEVYGEIVKGKTLTGTAEQYEAQVTFMTSSIRLYSPPLPVDFIQQLCAPKDITTYPGAYAELDWSIYPRILAEAVSKGIFVS